MKFADRLDRFGEEIFASLNNKKLELEAQGHKVYNLSVGTPDFKTPEHIRKALVEAASDPENWKIFPFLPESGGSSVFPVPRGHG